MQHCVEFLSPPGLYGQLLPRQRASESCHINGWCSLGTRQPCLMKRRERGTARCGCFQPLIARGDFEDDGNSRWRVVHNEKPLSQEHSSAIQFYLPNLVEVQACCLRPKLWEKSQHSLFALFDIIGNRPDLRAPDCSRAKIGRPVRLSSTPVRNPAQL